MAGIEHHRDPAGGVAHAEVDAASENGGDGIPDATVAANHVIGRGANPLNVGQYAVSQPAIWNSGRRESNPHDLSVNGF
jgi:hypothetical protein